MLTYDDSKGYLSHQSLCAVAVLGSSLLDNFAISVSIMSQAVCELLSIAAAIPSLPLSPPHPFCVVCPMLCDEINWDQFAVSVLFSACDEPACISDAHKT